MCVVIDIDGFFYNVFRNIQRDAAKLNHAIIFFIIENTKKILKKKLLEDRGHHVIV